MTKRIFVLYTGGTIGMSRSEHGLRPDTALVGKALAPFSDSLSFDWHVCDPLIDSSAVTLENWRDWLAILAEKIPQYDGTLVLHGTDTMAYTANILALALQGLNKPLVITGSQLPYDAPDSDAPPNLAAAVAAFSLELQEVAIVFNGKIFPAVGSSKVSTETAAGFDNPHFGALGRWNETDGWHDIQPRPSKLSDGLNTLALNPQAKVVCHTLTPGFAAQHMSDGLAHTAAQAAVLQSYGHGNAPSDEKFIQSVQTFTQKGGLMLNISQVPQGCAAAVYAQGSALRQAGVINAGKCNLETATALLTLAVSNGWTADAVQQKLADLGLV
ncbi:asparaginase [Neisseria chenwenguii]|uniref:L-asparaginase n=1 Tax=Neisseria chenwenguii TaxID=1853278 RepID=A0A220S314_9NEIS|nr:asparaginase [Neisseria chenwenguii]ASK27860.1 L-asparaginase [Neisseria chenwenguii]ROV56465.1 asparaginase [Neisseria chenwenguii]